MGSMRLMKPGVGDERIEWDPGIDEEVARAEKEFYDALERGMAAFKTDRRGERGEQIRKFDPNEEVIILVPPLRGG